MPCRPLPGHLLFLFGSSLLTNQIFRSLSNPFLSIDQQERTQVGQKCTLHRHLFVSIIYSFCSYSPVDGNYLLLFVVAVVAILEKTSEALQRSESSLLLHTPIRRSHYLHMYSCFSFLLRLEVNTYYFTYQDFAGKLFAHILRASVTHLLHKMITVSPVAVTSNLSLLLLK